MAGKIIINAERCKGCGLCIAVCPHQCITVACRLNGLGYFPAEFSKPIDCTGCAQCALMCPDVAIEVFLESDDPRGEMKIKSRTPTKT